MCPLYPFHLILLYLCLLLPLLLAVVEASEELSLFATKKWKVSFLPEAVDKLEETASTEVQLACFNCEPAPDGFNVLLSVYSDDPGIASVMHQTQESEGDGQEVVMSMTDLEFDSKSVWSTRFNVTGNFLGFTSVRARLKDKQGRILAELSKNGDASTLPVSIVRKKTIQSKVFAYSVAILISLAYINMGCAMDLKVVRETIRRPVGPVIGFVSQFLFMPLIAFGLGYFFESAPMRLGLFVTGTAPGGGASNIWTLLFGGNLNLSLTMTTISTFASFAMMPLWLFTLGTVIFSSSEIVIPYYKICTYAFCLVVPLGIGLLISRYLPRVSAWMVRILKPLALFLILFILIFGVWANLYMFKLMSWQVIVAGGLLPWLGFAFGCTFARLCGRKPEDVTAIAIETGVQNTGVAIFMLWFTLDHPLGDMAAVVPVATATMTPLPLLAALCVFKLREWMGYGPVKCSEAAAPNDEEDFKQSESNQKLMSHKEDSPEPEIIKA